MSNLYFPAQHFWSVWFSEVMIAFLRKNDIKISSSDTILDIGCGLGYNCFSLTEFKPASVSGFDISSDTINLLKEFPSSVDFKSVDICKDDISSYHKKYSLILSSDVYEHVESPIVMLESIYKLLKEGGNACITFPNQDDHGHNQFYDITIFEDLIKKAGFKKFNIEIIEYPSLIYRTFMKFYKLMQDATDKMMGINRDKSTRMPESDEFHEMYAYKKIQKIKDKKLLNKTINLAYKVIKKFARLGSVYKSSKDLSQLRDKRLIVLLQK